MIPTTASTTSVSDLQGRSRDARGSRGCLGGHERAD
jgi:hypothetical protein